MNNLLHANFSRIFKSNCFYAGLFLSAVCALLAGIFAINSDGVIAFYPTTTPLVILPMIIAAVVGLLAASEFSYGTMRNKIIIGHKHENIYTAELISLSAMSLIYYAVYEIIIFAIGMFFLDTTGISPQTAIITLLIMAVLFICSTAISLMICMVIHGNKSLVLVLLLQYALLFIGIMSDAVEDSETARVVAKFIPQGYTNSLSVYEMIDSPWQPVVYALILSIVVTLLGIYSFKNNDMK